MKCLKIITAIITLVLSNNTSAALIGRLGGLAYYDTDADLTWLADANSAGDMLSLASANTWAGNLIVDGVGGWRLPETLQPDLSCDYQNVDESSGMNCTGSEMGNLFYNGLGNTAGSLTNTGPFSNLFPAEFWSATKFEPIPGIDDLAWLFNMGVGAQAWTVDRNLKFAWAMQSGDVSAVPVPAAIWLFGSGLIGLFGVVRGRGPVETSES